jgi:hypothetical protein
MTRGQMITRAGAGAGTGAGAGAKVILICVTKLMKNRNNMRSLERPKLHK